jgi:hypothetical protein
MKTVYTVATGPPNISMRSVALIAFGLLALALPVVPATYLEL